MRISGKMMLWIVGLSLATTVALEKYRDRAPTGPSRPAFLRPA